MEYEHIQIEDFPDIQIANSVYAGDPQDITKPEKSTEENSKQVTPTKKSKTKRTKAEKEELKKKLKYFKMVCGGSFDPKPEENKNEAETEVAN